MDLGDLISPEHIIPSLNAKSKKHVLQELAKLAGEKLDIDKRAIFDILLQRERLGSTGVGYGIAIPHGRLSETKDIFCLFARLNNPIDFDSIDDNPVDLVFLLLAPESAGADHLKALSRISRLVRDPQFIDKLRQTSDPALLYNILSVSEKSHAA